MTGPNVRFVPEDGAPIQPRDPFDKEGPGCLFHMFVHNLCTQPVMVVPSWVGHRTLLGQEHVSAGQTGFAR